MKKIKHKRLEKCIFNRQQNDSGNKEGMELNMNIYDTANRLASEIKQSEEYINYKMAKETLNLNSELKKKIGEFEMARYEAQITQMQTGKEDEEKLNKMKQLYAELIEIEEARKFFEAETKFNIVIADVNKIIGEAIRDVMQ